MNPLLTALGSGMSAKKILEYLARRIPALSPKIAKALAGGITAEKLVNYFSKDENLEQIRNSNEKDYSLQNNANPLVQAQNVRSQNLGTDMASGLQRAIPKAIGTAAQVGGAYALSRAIPKMLQSPEAPNSLPQAIQTENQRQTPLNQPTSQPPEPINLPNTIPQATQIPQPEGIINPKDFLDKLGVTQKVDAMLQAKNNPEAIAAALSIDKTGKKVVGQIDPELTGAIDAYSKLPKNEPELEQQAIPAPILQPEPLVPEPEAKIEEPIKPIMKDQTVSSPEGIGEVKEIRGDNALIEIDGKLKKVPVEDLEEEPEDVIETVQSLLKIPEVDRSSIVSLFTYDPSDKEMYIQFHNGETYKYLDVDPEKVFKIANKMGIPVSEGRNIFGAWSPEDKKSLGATLIKEIINDAKYKKSKKGESENPNYRQLETLYDYWTSLRHKPKRKKTS